MNNRMGRVASRQYDEFHPETRFVSAEAAETVLVYLPEYKKEQLRVQLTPTRLLNINGERPLGGNKWQRFMKDVRVPPNCATREITAKFEGGILHLSLPRVMMSPEALQQPPQPITSVVPAPSPSPTDGKFDGLVTSPTPNNEGETKERAETSKLVDMTSKGECKGIYKELKRPENLKVLAVIVVVAIALALHIGYVNRVCRIGK